MAARADTKLTLREMLAAAKVDVADVLDLPLDTSIDGCRVEVGMPPGSLTITGIVPTHREQGFGDRLEEAGQARYADPLGESYRTYSHHDEEALVAELCKTEENPEWGQGPGTLYYAQTCAALAFVRRLKGES